MTDTNIRSDLVDRGVFQMPGRETRQAGKTAPRLYEGGEMAADSPHVLALNMKGEQTDNEAEAVAKRVQHGQNRVHYFLKFSTDGVDRGSLLDPRGMYFEARHMNTVQARRGRSKYEFREVEETVFRDYIHYLSSKDATYLRSAERQAING